MAVQAKSRQARHFSQSTCGARPGAMEMAPEGQTAAQTSQPFSHLQEAWANIRCLPCIQLSGFAHQRHWSGQPVMNTVVRQPGPSWTEKDCMSKICPIVPISQPCIAL